jgi:hypothetical protein
VPFVAQAQSRGPQGLESVDAGRPVADSTAQHLDGVHRPVQQQVFLAREVFEHRHARHPGLAGDLGHRHRVESTVEEQPGRYRRDAGACLRPTPGIGPGHPAPSVGSTYYLCH